MGPVAPLDFSSRFPPTSRRTFLASFLVFARSPCSPYVTSSPVRRAVSTNQRISRQNDSRFSPLFADEQEDDAETLQTEALRRRRRRGRGREGEENKDKNGPRVTVRAATSWIHRSRYEADAGRAGRAGRGSGRVNEWKTRGSHRQVPPKRDLKNKSHGAPAGAGLQDRSAYVRASAAEVSCAATRLTSFRVPPVFLEQLQSAASASWKSLQRRRRPRSSRTTSTRRRWCDVRPRWKS